MGKGDPATRADLLDRSAQLAERQGDYGHAQALIDEQLTLARRLGDKQRLLGALMRAGIGAAVRGDLNLAYRHLQEVLEPVDGTTAGSWLAPI